DDDHSLSLRGIRPHQPPRGDPPEPKHGPALPRAARHAKGRDVASRGGCDRIAASDGGENRDRRDWPAHIDLRIESGWFAGRPGRRGPPGRTPRAGPGKAAALPCDPRIPAFPREGG